MNTLLDLIAVVIGFSLVMLLLSLVVTAVVQFLQHIFSMRSSNLEHGLEQLFEIVLRPTAGELEAARPKTEAQGRDGSKKQQEYAALQADVKETAGRARAMARRTMNASNFTEAPSRLRSVLALFFTKRGKTTWLTLDDVLARLKLIGERPLSAGQRERLETFFPRMEDFLSKQFTVNIRIVTVFVGLLVAAYFQVSAIELLRDLSTDREMRERYVAAAEGVMDKVETSFAALEPHENFSEEALVRLQENHPDLTRQIEEASGIGRTRDEIIAELELILSEDRPGQMRAVVQEYGEILDGLHGEQAGVALREARTYMNELSRLNIDPWARGWAFFADFGNIAGVLITGIFLTFGAPFWYKVLGEAIKLKDVLKDRKEEDKEDEKQSGKPAPVTIVIPPTGAATGGKDQDDAK